MNENRAYEKGFEAGKLRGREEGYKQCQRDILDLLDRQNKIGGDKYE
ncbi:MAG: hypothetical protein V5A64_07165 [Candidatus Thermoplasmatota archaeon]